MSPTSKFPTDQEPVAAPRPPDGGRYYLIDGAFVPASEVELPSDPYNLLPIVGAWPDAAVPTETEE